MDWFIQLHKKICEWEWYTDIPTCKLFLHILLKCNYKGAKWRWIDVKPWDFITSLDHLSNETWLSVRQVRTALEHLETTWEVTKQTTSQYTILTLNNWGSYNIRDDKPTTNEWQTNDKRMTITNKKYKEKKDNKENNIKAIEEKLKTLQGWTVRYDFYSFLLSIEIEQEIKNETIEAIDEKLEYFYKALWKQFISEMENFIIWHKDKKTKFSNVLLRLNSWFSKKLPN